MRETPDYLASTIRMLRSAFPSGIADDDLPVLMAVMHDTGMSARNVATALGVLLDQDYAIVLHDVSTCELDSRVTEDAKARMIERLRAYGYESWCTEE